MAPDSRCYRHQLGEARISLQRRLLKASVVISMMLSLTATNIQARTEPDWDSFTSPLPAAVPPDRPFWGTPRHSAPLSPPLTKSNTSPVGQWNEGIQIHIPNQPEIEKYVRFFMGTGRSTLEDALERSQPYAPVMQDILAAHGVPSELISVAVVESCFRRNASHRGAGGYWQLLAGTARSLGLRVDRWVDERRDPIKSTQAAAVYLRSFYDQFNSWPLAIAAYNAGGSPVAKALARAGTGTFWEISRRGILPSITRAYVPKVLAAIHVMRDLEAYGFKRPRPFPVHDFESITVHSPLKLNQVAGWINVPVTRLQELNPSLRLDRLPPDCGFNLNLPSGARDRFDLAYQEHLRN